MGIQIFQVDAFTDKPFAGNPAAVCILPGPANEEWMQNVAKEMNLSETAFLYRQDDGFNLRWFTPTIEVNLCGHATLASAHILWENAYLKQGGGSKVLYKERLPYSFSAYQASSRGGVVQVKISGDRVYLSGQAVTIFKGDLVIK